MHPLKCVVLHTLMAFIYPSCFRGNDGPAPIDRYCVLSEYTSLLTYRLYAYLHAPTRFLLLLFSKIDDSFFPVQDRTFRFIGLERRRFPKNTQTTKCPPISQMLTYIFVIQTSVCMGFTSAGFIHVHCTQSTLFVIGIITMIADILVFMLKCTVQKSNRGNFLMFAALVHRAMNYQVCL